MEADLISQLMALVQVIFIDLVLAGDNAIVVGMAAASVPLADRRRVIFWGIAAAVVLRIFFALVTTQLLAIIGLTLAGGLLLAFVAYQMYRELRTHGQDEVAPEEALEEGERKQPKTVVAAVWQVALADLSMSLDNVLAVAGAAKDHLEVLVVGLVISIVMMAFAANFIAKLIHKHRWVAWIGLLIIAYVAVDMIVRGMMQVAAAMS
ncbi:MAG: TerC family protein [Gammaproteobacteria bacterium]|jgi:YjbE family integral membrane protein|nr:YjbE family putative metal transport protein [Candidatus Thioaporhodococcus sediminis]TNF57356.1 MAG: TerC family protein [Gammaproteobacteria bacterium]